CGGCGLASTRPIVSALFSLARCTVTWRCATANSCFAPGSCWHLASHCCLAMPSSPGSIFSPLRFAESCWLRFSTFWESSSTGLSRSPDYAVQCSSWFWMYLSTNRKPSVRPGETCAIGRLLKSEGIVSGGSYGVGAVGLEFYGKHGPIPLRQD